MISVADKVRAAFPFSVVKLPLYGPDRLPTKHYGMFRDDNQQNVGIACKQGYTPHTVDDIVALAEAAVSALPSGAGCEVKGYWRDGHYLTVAPSKEYRQHIFGSDTIWPRMVIKAGYDGRAFDAQLGFYRDACKNLAILRSAGLCTSRVIRHTSQLRDKMADLVITFRELANGWNQLADTCRAMDSRVINLPQFLAEVYPQGAETTGRARTNWEKRVAAITRRIIHERLTLARPERTNLDHATAWEAFNGVQGYVQHDLPRRGRNAETSAFGRAVLAMHDVAVNRAMELALAS